MTDTIAEIRNAQGQDHPPAPLELYDIIADPGELRNVAAEHPDVVERLRKQLAGIREQDHSWQAIAGMTGQAQSS